MRFEIKLCYIVERKSSSYMGVPGVCFPWVQAGGKMFVACATDKLQVSCQLAWEAEDDQQPEYYQSELKSHPPDFT